MIAHGLADGLFVVINGAEERQCFKCCEKMSRVSSLYVQIATLSAVLVDLRKMMWVKVAHTMKGTSCGLWSM